jgi:hypothetical protein
LNTLDSKSILDALSSRILSFARKLGIAGILLMVAGVSGFIASSGDTDQLAFGYAMLCMAALGALCIGAGFGLIRFLMKTTKKQYSLFVS